MFAIISISITTITILLPLLLIKSLPLSHFIHHVLLSAWRGAAAASQVQHRLWGTERHTPEAHREHEVSFLRPLDEPSCQTPGLKCCPLNSVARPISASPHMGVVKRGVWRGGRGVVDELAGQGSGGGTSRGGKQREDIFDLSKRVNVLCFEGVKIFLWWWSV